MAYIHVHVVRILLFYSGHAIPSGGDCRSSSTLDLSSALRPDGRPAKAVSRPFNLKKHTKCRFSMLISTDCIKT